MQRKFSKRLLAALLAVALLVGMLPTLVLAEENTIKWEVENGVLKIAGNGAIPSYADGAPWKDMADSIVSIEINAYMSDYHGVGITYVGDYAFSGLYNVTSVNVRATAAPLDGYGSYVFSGCSKLETFGFYNSTSVTTISEGMFYGCENLRYVRLPGSITYVGKDAFFGTSVGDSEFASLGGSGVYYEGSVKDWRNVTVCEGNEQLLRGIEKAFVYKDELTYTLEDGTLTISGMGDMRLLNDYNKPFYSSDVKRVIIEEGVTSVSAGAFSSCSNLEEVSFPSTLKTIDTNAFTCTLLTEVTIPEGVTHIGDDAFQNCWKLRKVTIPASVTQLGATEINNFAFTGCNSLETITVDENNPNYSSDDRGVLFNKDKTRILYVPAMLSGHYDIPDSVERITGAAFSKCVNLTSVSIPAKLKLYPGNGMPESLTVEELWEAPDVRPFSHSMVSLSRYTVDPNNEIFSSDAAGALLNKSQTVLFSVPASMTGSYTIPESVTTLAAYAVNQNQGLEELVITKNVRSFGFGCLYSTNLKSIVFQEGMTVLDESFAGLTMGVSGNVNPYVERVTIPASMVSIPDSAFMKYDGLTDVYYGGTEEQWAKIAIGENNEPLLNATIHYNTPSTEPTTPVNPTEPNKPTDPTSPTEPDNKVDVDVNIPTHDPDKTDETTIGASQSNAEKILRETLEKIIAWIKEKTEEAEKNLENILPKELIEVITQVADDTSNLEIVSSVDVSTIDPSSELNEETKQDIEKIHKEGGNAKIAQYMDLSVVLTAYVNGEEAASGNVSELSDKLEFTVSLSDDLKTVPGGYNRTYFVIRVHNGEVTRLPATVNKDGSITFATDKFSTYALAYEDTKVVLSTPATGDSANLMLWVTTLALSGLGLVLSLSYGRKKRYVGRYL